MPGRKTIHQLRREQGWTQAELATRLGVVPWTVAAWERGLVTPQPRHRMGLAELFVCTLSWCAVSSTDCGARRCWRWFLNGTHSAACAEGRHPGTAAAMKELHDAVRPACHNWAEAALGVPDAGSSGVALPALTAASQEAARG